MVTVAPFMPEFSGELRNEARKSGVTAEEQVSFAQYHYFTSDSGVSLKMVKSGFIIQGISIIRHQSPILQ
jgi:hypothetical protein